MDNLIKKIDINGLLFDNVSMDDALSKMENKIKEGRAFKTLLLCVANQDIINKMHTTTGLNKNLINESFLIIPDGFSIIYAAKFLGKKFKQRVAGPDLMEKFIEISAKKGYKNFFLGAKEGVAQKMADNLLQKHPDLQITGIYSPPFGDFTDEENKKIIDMVNTSNSDVLWVSFGCPKQEKWILENKNKLNVPIAVGIGAAFDFLSGNINRAPLILRKLRLEWFYRFLQEPARLWKRYFLGGIKFAKIIIKQRLRSKN